jgi:hypothetical protein
LEFKAIDSLEVERWYLNKAIGLPIGVNKSNKRRSGRIKIIEEPVRLRFGGHNEVCHHEHDSESSSALLCRAQKRKRIKTASLPSSRLLFRDWRVELE